MERSGQLASMEGAWKHLRFRGFLFPGPGWPHGHVWASPLNCARLLFLICTIALIIFTPKNYFQDYK